MLFPSGAEVSAGNLTDLLFNHVVSTSGEIVKPIALADNWRCLMRSKRISLDEVRKACEELAEMGLIRDSGRRRNGEIVWVVTPLLADLPEDSSKQ